MATDIRFHHIVNLPRIDSQIATARDSRNKTHIYLIVNHQGPVYKRNGLNETWDMVDAGDRRNVLDTLDRDTGICVKRYTAGHFPA